LPTYSSPANGLGVDDSPIRLAFFVDPNKAVASSPLDSDSDSDSILVDSILRFTGRLTGEDAGRGGGRDAFSFPLLEFDDVYGFGLLCVDLEPIMNDNEISGREGVDVDVDVDDLGGIGFFVITLRTTGPPEPGCFF
jgi:hypothetical protein